MQHKTPRRYASDYLDASTKEGQIAALKGCPAELQALVRTHIETQLKVARFAAGQRAA